MLKILVTGGAGYIGSHVVRTLCDRGYEVVVLDNLSNGHRSAVDKRADFVSADLSDLKSLRDIFSTRKFDVVMHFAGLIEAGLSMKEPRAFFDANVVCGMNLLEAMREFGVARLIFSSTAAVYGNLEGGKAIKETSLLEPVNFYGVTKLMFENLLKKYDEFWGIKSISLRYFNAAGADESGEIGEDHDPETHLIPLVLQKILADAGKCGEEKAGKVFKIFGDDYATKDGTCVRDYIHVKDLADAHVLALEHLLKKGESDVFNLGNGKGFSVMEVIKAAEKITGRRVSYEMASRREGDPAILVADSAKATKVLGWKPKYYKLEDIVASAWRWHELHPEGYGEG